MAATVNQSPAPQTTGRILIAVPAHNEGATIAEIVCRIRACLPTCDLVVVDDGSSDDTPATLKAVAVPALRHLCNLGYGRAIQTALLFSIRERFDTLVTLDADGQHAPEELPALLAAFHAAKVDYLVGSRYVTSRSYRGNPLGRRVGMQVFSVLTRLITGRRVYDTTSGMKVISRSVFEPLSRWHFVDFHAETIVYLALLGYRIGEHPITVAPRHYGQSMYSAISHIAYPLKTFLMLVLGIVEARLLRGSERP
jgi:glycosyltransferase involved in cell wall biosynthesis